MPNYPAITSKTMKYPSPSGKVNVGKYIPPFEPVKKGFGFMGVLVEDSKSGKLQCHACGEWFKNLSTHVTVNHFDTCNDYKEAFGLSVSTALKSKAIRLRQSEVMIDLRKKNKKNRIKFKKNNSFAGNRKDKPKSQETVNKYGVCDLQLAHKVLSLKEKLGKTPTLLDLKAEYGGVIMTHLHKRYGSYIKYCKDLGIEPRFSNYNPKYSREYFIEKALSNEASVRIFTESEARNLYQYIKGGIPELKEIVEKIKNV